MKNIMVDLETLGTSAGCSILSIGAVFFDAEGLGEEFYTPVNRQSCLDAGLVEKEDTVKWWSQQNAGAQKVLRLAGLKKTPTLAKALEGLSAFIKKDTSVKVWGNGADFDNPILIVAYERLGMEQGWGNWNGRCYRTLKSIAAGPKLDRAGTHHNALDDAKSQALHAIALFKLHPNLVM